MEQKLYLDTGEALSVKEINNKLTYPFILNKHYAKRLPSISYAYGLYMDKELIGVLTIGKPASPSLCVGVCGKEYSKYVYELNRLCVNDGLPKNALSYFVGSVLRKLKYKEIIIISYADSALHHGYIYQATNWLYTGQTKERTDKYTPKNKHCRHYTDEYDYLRKVRTAKYRYLYVPNKKFKKEVLKHLKYHIFNEYPKGDNRYYKLGQRLKTKVINNETGQEYYE